MKMNGCHIMKSLPTNERFGWEREKKQVNKNSAHVHTVTELWLALFSRRTAHTICWNKDILRKIEAHLNGSN